MNRAFWGLVKKEFIQIFRDINMIRLIFAIPVIQLLLFGYVVNLEVKKIRLDIYDFNQSSYSRELIEASQVGNYFNTAIAKLPIFKLEENFQRSKSDMALIIPHQLSEKLLKKEKVTIGLLADGSDANSTAIGTGYLVLIVQKFINRFYHFKNPLNIKFDVLYNPEAKSVYFMVPGIVASLLLMLTVMLTSMAIVREKEGGTLEQLLVTPISTTTFLLGKIFPFAVLGMIEMIITLVLGILWFGIPFVGSPMLLMGLSALFLLTTLGMGLFFSTVTSTQQQAMFFAWFFSIFALMTSGFFTPIANMPKWMQYVTYINPMRYFMVIVRGIMMKGAGLYDLLPQIYPLIIFGVVIFSFSILRFHKRAG